MGKNILLLVCVINFSLLACLYIPFLPDDAFITFRYARNLAGGELAYNPGEKVEGFSNFLWVLVCAALMPLKDIGFILMAGYFCGVCALYLVWRISPWGAFALSLSGPFAAYAVSGMETALFALLLVGVITAQRGKRQGLAFLLGCLLVLCRPEGVIVFPLLAYDRADRLMPFAFFTGLVLFARFCYFGTWLPVSFHAKITGFQIPELLRSNFIYWFYAKERAYSPVGYYYLVLVCLVCAFGWKSRAWLPAIGLGLVYVFTYSWMPGGRLFVPLLAVVFLILKHKNAMKIAVILGLVVNVLMWKDAQSIRMQNEVLQEIGTTFRGYETIAASDVGQIGWYSGARILDIHPRPLVSPRRDFFDVMPDAVIFPIIKDGYGYYPEHVRILEDVRFQAYRQEISWLSGSGRIYEAWVRLTEKGEQDGSIEKQSEGGRSHVIAARLCPSGGSGEFPGR